MLSSQNVWLYGREVRVSEIPMKVKNESETLAQKQVIFPVFAKLPRERLESKKAITITVTAAD